MKRIVLFLFLFAAVTVRAQNALFIPDTISGTNFSLTLHKDSVQFLPGKKTQTYGINSNHYLGPTLLWNKDDSLNISVNNNIGDTATIHWHGLHVAAINDGGPHTMIMNGDTWSPKFKVRNRAATYWYHSHMMGKTAQEAMMGIAGLLIVRDNDEAALTLPRRYGLDDFPIIVQTHELDSQNQDMPRGMVDSIILVNGTFNPFVNMPAQVVRLRLLNAAGERTFNFGFSANKSFRLIANDNGLLPAPVTTTRIRLSPGERAEVLIDLSGMSGQTIYLISYASELPMGIQGGPTMPMPPWSPPMNSPLNGIDFNILKMVIGPATTIPVTTIPASLVPDTAYPEATAVITRRINISADSAMVMDGPFYFNDSLFNMMRIDYTIPIGHTEIWKIVNNTMVAHPFHIHDEHFYILDRHGAAPDVVERGRKDVVLVPPYDSVRFIVRFQDFTDTTTPYMYHCHILMHEDDGMMGQFVVSPINTSVNNLSRQEQIMLYPNPAKDNIVIWLQGAPIESIEIRNLFRQLIYASSVNTNKTQIDISSLLPGMYFIQVNNKYVQKFVKE